MFAENCNGFTLFYCKFPQISSFKAIFFLFYDIFLCFSSGQLYSCMCVISGKNCPEADFCPTTSEDHFRFCLVNVDFSPPGICLRHQGCHCLSENKEVSLCGIKTGHLSIVTHFCQYMSVICTLSDAF